MILVDSSGWIEFFLDNSKAASFEKYVAGRDTLLVPTLVVYEVYRQLIKNIEEKEVLVAITQMEKSALASLDYETALFAAELSLKHKLGTADAIIYATALIHDAKLVTLDNDFRDLPQCVVID